MGMNGRLCTRFQGRESKGLSRCFRFHAAKIRRGAGLRFFARTSRPMPARFHEPEVASRLRHRRRLSAFLDALVAQYLPGTALVKLTCIFVSDEALLEMNQQFLQHDTYTDIITFDQSEGEGEMTGEIYISVDRVAENARNYKTDYNTELHRVIFHGALHLCGLLDKTAADATAMRSAEDAALETYFSTPDSF